MNSAAAGALAVLRQAVDRSPFEWVAKIDPLGRCWWLKCRGRQIGVVRPGEKPYSPDTYSAHLMHPREVSRHGFRTLRSVFKSGTEIRQGAAEWLLDEARDDQVSQGITGARRRRLHVLHGELERQLHEASRRRTAEETENLAFFVGCLDAFLKEGAGQIERVQSCAKKCGYLRVFLAAMGVAS